MNQDQLLNIAALLTQSHVTSHKPLSVDRTMNVFEQFYEQLRGVEVVALLPPVSGNKSEH